MLARNGGHLGPNLGVVELTIALHYVFTTPKDKFIWDVSHQSYVHKLLTGRRDRFHTIRSTGGLSGFRSAHRKRARLLTAPPTPAPRCRPRWAWRRRATSAARDENVVSIFGDAALTNGISFEALNNIAHTTKRFIGILNDNEWSIAKNVGAISELPEQAHHPPALTTAGRRISSGSSAPPAQGRRRPQAGPQSRGRLQRRR